MAASNYVAFDLGAESGRAVLGTLDNGRLTLSEQHRFASPRGRINGHLHWNLMSMWDQLKEGLRKAANANKGGELSGIGVDTWGVDFGLVGRSGEVLANPYMYRDSMTDGVMERTFQRVSRQRIFQATGLQFMQLNTLFQLIAMQEMNSPLLDAAQTLLFMPDLFNYLFTGQCRNEFSIASTSQMYDPRARTWAVKLVDELGLPSRILGQIVPSGTVLGPIRADVAEECGVGPVPVIAPACHDTGSAVAAVPAEGSDWCYISSGTWSLMGVELDEPLVNDKALQYDYTNEGGVGGTIRFLKNIMGMWLVQECRRAFAARGQAYSYAQLTQMAQDATGLRSLISTTHKPFSSPGQMPEKIAQYCKDTRQPVPDAPGQFVRACLDSLALAYRYTLEGMEDVLGRRIKVIHLVGGGTQNELLNQMTADACGRSVITGPVEATAAGNILVQAMADGQVKSVDQIRQIVRNSFDVKHYQPNQTRQWDAAYARYRELMTH